MRIFHFQPPGLIILGLKEVAVAMADPFGEDVLDFRIESFLAQMYNNALGMLTERFEPLGSSLPPGLENPLPADLRSAA